MKKLGLYIVASLFSMAAMAEYVIYVNDGETRVREEKCVDVDSVKLSGLQVSLYKGAKIYQYSNTTANFTFEKIVTANDTVKITYQGLAAPIIENPYPETILISVDGANVSVNCVNQLKDVVYLLQGTSQNGSFYIDSPRKFSLVLNNLSLVSAGECSAIRSLSGSAMTIVLPNGTASAVADTNLDTCNATLRSKGQILFSEEGNGSLSVFGNAKRAIQSGDYIKVDGGNIVATSTVGDVIKVNDYFKMCGGSLEVRGTGLEVSAGYAFMNGGTLTINSTVEDSKGIKVAKDTTGPDYIGNGSMDIYGGTLNINMSGAGTKGVKAEGDINIYGGTIVGNVTSPYLIEPNDVSYAALMKADKSINISEGQISIVLAKEAIGARGLASDSGITISGKASINILANNDAYLTEKSDGTLKAKQGHGIKTDGDVNITGKSTLNIRSAASSYSSYCITANNIIFNESNVSTFYSFSNCVFNSKTVKLQNGIVVAATGNGFAPGGSSRLAAMGATYIGVGSKNSILYGSTLSVMSDSKYVIGSAISVQDAANNPLLIYQSESSDFNMLVGYLQVASPQFIKDVPFIYSCDGVVLGGTNYHGYMIGSTYSAGASYSFTAGAPNSNVTVK